MEELKKTSNTGRPMNVRADSLKVHPTAQRQIVPSWRKFLYDNMDLDAIGTITVVDYTINGVPGPWIVDGQHRWLALMDHGFGDWRVSISMRPTVKDDVAANELFLELNNRKVVATWDKFERELNAHKADALGIVSVAHKLGLKVSKVAGEGALNCVATLKKLYLVDDGETLSGTLSIAKQAFGTSASALEGKVIEALGLVVRKYNGTIKKEEIIKKLAKYPGGASGLLADGKGMQDYRRINLARCIAERIIEEYNKKKTVGKLDPL